MTTLSDTHHHDDFIPSFLTIKARQIESWADEIDARSRLSVLLRKLVHSTGCDLHQVDFPGYDNAQRHGPDGIVKSVAPNPWIPEGVSYWEFGTDKNPRGKAEKDYSARLKSVDSAERANSTFVFVTPRNWPGKTEWENQKNETGDWKGVRAFDASNLEQWLEQAVPAQIWLAEQLNHPTSGYKTLERVWHRWANVSEPHLTPEIFASSVAAYRDKFKDWLDKPSKKPFVVAADSRDEALAFLACLFDNEDLRQYKDRAAVFTSPEVLKKLVASSVNFIPIVHSHDTERELGDAHRRLHCIAFRTRNAVDTKADITLDLLSHDAFEKALTVLGLEREKIERLARESGRSPTVLRRRLSENDAIRTPEWACDDKTAKDLVPMALIGTWHAESEADREIVSYVADRKYEEIEDGVARLLGFDDSPVWSAGRFQGVTSKIDALFAIAERVISADLDRFFTAAEYVLSESDPALELPEEKRWAAPLYGKKRNHSSALRESICDTLVILSVHGNDLFHSRLGINVEDRVEGLIRRLLMPLTLEKLLSHDHDLPRFAEAAPSVFLDLIEEDLQSKDKDPIVFGLLKPVDSTWASPSRTGLLWALECLAWKPQNLSRVSLILAKLSQRKIDDNWMNKPGDSLQDIFRSWIPQTASSVGDRVKVLEMLNKRFPDIGWMICITQIQSGSQTAFPNYRPRWRSDASGVGQVVTNKERYDFDRKALDLLIDWPSHDEKTLGDLIESLSCMSEKDQTKVWDLIQKWSQNATESAKAVLRERIRCSAFSRPSRRKLEEATRDRAREVYESLRPHDPVIRHGCLFANPWVRESADEIEEDFDPQKHAERIDRLRRDAMTEIWTECGFPGVKELLAGSDAADIVGQYMSSCITDVKSRIVFIKYCLSLDGDFQSKAEQCLQGFLISIEEDSCTGVLQTTAKELSTGDRVRLFVCAPFQASTWRLLDSYGEDIRAEYWNNVSPSRIRHTPAELTELIDCLLEVRRPRAAFQAVHMKFKDIETSRLKQLLREVATVNAEPESHYLPERYNISKALDSLDNRPGVTRDEMAELEFMFIRPLEYSRHGIPNLENQITESPEFFARVVARIYKRSDDGEDPLEWKIEDPKQRKAAAWAARHLLRVITKIPGTNDDGKIDGHVLAAWISEVRQLCRNYARVDIGDHCIGELLAKAPAGKNGIWPCESVCKAMEGMASTKIGEGFYFGTRNSRGVIELDEGGKQEHERATKYRAWAKHLHFDYPFVGRVLEDIAASCERDAEMWDSNAEVRKRRFD